MTAMSKIMPDNRYLDLIILTKTHILQDLSFFSSRKKQRFARLRND